MTSVVFGCPHCGRAVELEDGQTSGACGRCGEPVEIGVPGNDACAACRCPELYRHRDFNQKLGLLLIAVGAGLWIWSGSFLPMVVAAAIDVVLYFLLPDVGICYRCKAHYRGFPWIATLPSFDLERHEHYRFERVRAEGEPADDRSNAKAQRRKE